MVYDQLFLFGDSLFQHSSSQECGFNLAPALQAEYIRRLDVVNRGFSGYNTNQALAILPRIMPSPEQTKVRFMVILLGANDACLEGADGSQHVPLTTYKENMEKIISHPTVQKQNPRIIVVSPPPINEHFCLKNDRAKGLKQPRRNPKTTKMYAAAAKEVADRQQVAFLDLYKVLIEHAGGSKDDEVLQGSIELPPNPFLRLLLHDGLHLSSVAYSLLFEELMRTVQREWPDQMPEKLPYVLPVWNDATAWSAAKN